MTPLIDVLFLLLIFFIVSTRFIETPALKITLPKAKNHDQVAHSQTLITISQEGRLFLKKVELTQRELMQHLSRETDHNKSILIRADRRAEFHHIVTILNLLREDGFRNIATVIATE